MYACNGILFNHESPHRGETFVTRKITRGIAEILHGRQQVLFLGNMNARRDWGHAKDYVEAMWLILQQKIAEDFVIATGISTTVREFVQRAFEHCGVVISFKGKGKREIGFVKKIRDKSHKIAEGQVVVRVDERYYRPTEVELLVGDASKARKKLGWKPSYSLEQLIAEMMNADMKKTSNLIRFS
jgi:GDPmannose 4,6-dehydratase